MDRIDQAQAALKRYHDSAPQREALREQQRAEGVKVADTLDQLEARASRLVDTGRLPARSLLAAVREPTEPKVVLERIIGEVNDLQPVTFLTRGAEVSRTIGRIGLDRAGRLVPFGTGVLVGRRLLLTNNHVLDGVERATASRVEFDCDPGRPLDQVVIVGLAPGRLFITDEQLDFTLVALEDLPDGRPPGDEFGWNVLISQQGKIVTGEAVNIVGHPMGRTKEIAVRNNELSNQHEHFLHYTTDTEPGNSGSPVYNDTWEMVALHHAGVPATDDDGHLLRKDGALWQRGDGDQAIRWIANEGLRVSVLLAHLAALELAPEQRAVLGGLATEEPASVPAAVTAHPPVEHDSVAPSADGTVRVDQALDAAPATTGREREGGRGIAPPPDDHARGTAATGGPYGGETQLIFLHGRSQQGRDPARLRAAWTGGLVRGLAATGLPPIAAEHAWFPFYGDALAAALTTRESLLLADVEVDPAESLAPEDPTTRSLYEALLEEAALAAGMPESLARGSDGKGGDGEAEVEESRLLGGVVSRVHRQASWIAGRSGLDEVVIARAFRDVAAYLDRQQIRDLVLDEVLEGVPDHGPVVLVCHSLGTVVGMDLLTRLPDAVDVVAFVTAGSPLGMDAVYKRLLVGGPHLPERVTTWANAWCAADAVAVGCPLARRWGQRVTDVLTDNAKARAHDIEEYLADERIAATIGRALSR